MNRGRYLERKTERELRELLENVARTQMKVSDYREKVLKKLGESNSSLKKLGRIEESLKYYIGKKKAEKCPAWKETYSNEGLCLCHFKYASTKFLVFKAYCSNCTLSKEEAKRMGVFNYVLG
jgi:hypothetical protein